MVERICGKEENGIHLINFCKGYLKEAPLSFIYKMLRKKNIILNGKKADGHEILKTGDSVRIYFSDETINKFSGNIEKKSDNNNLLNNSDISFEINDYSLKNDIDSFEKNNNLLKRFNFYYKKNVKDLILFETEDFLIFNKPAGLLSQKACKTDLSANELLRDYLLQSGKLHQETLSYFHPSICNRLDRNTSGILLYGKTPNGSRYLNEKIKNGEIEKFYLAGVQGYFSKSGIYHNYILKDSKNNISKVISPSEYENSNDKNSFQQIYTEYKLLSVNSTGAEKSLVEIHLHTGKSHQIRAELSYLGNPVIGDPKYGIKRNDFISKQYIKNMKYNHNTKVFDSGLHIKYQMLHAWYIILDGQKIVASPPEIFANMFPEL